MRYRNAIESLITELRANPRINVLQATLPKPADATYCATVARRLHDEMGIVVPRGMLDLYGELDGFTLVWEPKPEIKVIDPQLLLTAPEGLTWRRPPCYTQLVSISELGTVGEVDHVFWGDDVEVAGGTQFLIDHDQEEQGTWLVGIDGETQFYYVHHQGEDVNRLTLDFDAYFAKFLALRGFFCWQEMLVGESDESERSRRWMDALFCATAWQQT